MLTLKELKKMRQLLSMKMAMYFIRKEQRPQYFHCTNVVVMNMKMPMEQEKE